MRAVKLTSRLVFAGCAVAVLALGWLALGSMSAAQATSHTPEAATEAIQQLAGPSEPTVASHLATAGQTVVEPATRKLPNLGSAEGAWVLMASGAAYVIAGSVILVRRSRAAHTG